MMHLLPKWVEIEKDGFFAVGLSIAIGFTYIVCNGFFSICSACGIFRQYKLPRKPAQEPSAKLIQDTLLQEFLSHFVTGPILMVLVVGPILRQRNDAAVEVEDIPMFATIWAQIMIVHLLNEVWFYWGHRLLHHPFFYARIHKQHHSYIATRSIAAEYAHVVEDVITAYIPYMLGLFLTRAHFHVVFLWFGCRLFETYESHSGYCFAGSFPQRYLGLTNSRQSAHHWSHHLHNRGCFGNELLDHLCGTMDFKVDQDNQLAEKRL